MHRYFLFKDLKIKRDLAAENFAQFSPSCLLSDGKILAAIGLVL